MNVIIIVLGVNPTERDAILQLEEELLNGELDIPVYFAEVSLDIFIS